MMSSTSASMNRRRHDRHPCDLRVWLRDPSPKNERIYLVVHNIGAGGMLCKCSQPLELNGRVEMDMRFPGLEKLANLDGSVRHVSQGREGEYLIGIQFDKIENVTQEEFVCQINAVH